jgi:hypothetical protein
MDAGQRIHPECIEGYAQAQSEKSARASAKRVLMAAKVDKALTKQRREKLKSKAQWAKEAQTEFNKFIRLRDADQPCISCGRHHTGQYHAGHFLSVGARPELRFTESNVHKQCAPCNTHLSGNAVLFRRGLIAKLGPVCVEWLEGNHQPRRDTVDTLIALKREYAAKARALEVGQ